MPYNLESARKDIAEKGLNAVVLPGDLNYFISTVMLKMWNAAPKYATAHQIRRELVTEPKNSPFLQNLRNELADRFTVADIYTAAALAWDEFSNRVLRLYEAKKCRENGDLPGYVEAITPLLKELQTEIKKESASQIILPGGAAK